MTTAWQPPAPARRSGKPMWMWLAGGCAGLFVLGSIAVCGGLLAMTGGNEGGVRYTNNMEGYALEYIQAHQLLAPGETIVAYYDVTLGLDATESVILTDRRLLYDRAGQTTAVALAEIADVRVSEQPLIGDVVDVSARDGSRMHIEIAPLNGGDGFIRALDDQRNGMAGMVRPSSYGAGGSGGRL